MFYSISKFVNSQFYIWKYKFNTKRVPSTYQKNNYTVFVIIFRYTRVSVAFNLILLFLFHLFHKALTSNLWPILILHSYILLSLSVPTFISAKEVIGFLFKFINHLWKFVRFYCFSFVHYTKSSILFRISLFILIWTAILLWILNISM